MALNNVNNLVTLVDELELFANSHYQIERFKFEFEEQLENFSTEGKTFPIMYAVPVDFGKNGQTDSHTIRIYILARLNRDRDNTLSNLNSTSLILNDVIKYWNSSNRKSEVLLLNEPFAQAINNSELDYLQGYFADFEFELKSYSKCDIPIPDGIPRVTASGSSFIDPYLTCGSLNDCSVFTSSIFNLQNQIDNLDAEKWTFGVVLDGTELDFTRNDGSTYSVDLQPLITDIENDINILSGSVSQNRLDIDSNDIDILNLQNDLSSATSSIQTNTNNITILDNNTFQDGQLTGNILQFYNGSSTLIDSVDLTTLSFLTLSGGTITGDLSITGNIEVLGTMSTIDTETLQAKDNNIVLNYQGTHTSALNGGITIEDGVANGSDSSLQIDSNGNWYTLQNLGIGTNNPLAPLHIQGDATTRLLIDGDTAGGAADDVYLGFRARNVLEWSVGINQDNFYISPEDGLNNPHMTILGGGNVGIGTSTPEASLHNVGEFRNTETFRTGNATEPGRWRFYDTTGYLMSFYTTATDYDNWGLHWDTAPNIISWRGSGVVRSSIDLDSGDGYFQGNVGIGVTSPTRKLEVDGNFRFATDGSNNNALIWERLTSNQWRLNTEGIGEVFRIVGNSMTFKQGAIIERQGLTVNPTLQTPNAIDVNTTWDDATVDFKALEMNITDTNSLTTSSVISANVDSTNIFDLRKDGKLIMTGNTEGIEMGYNSIQNHPVNIYADSSDNLKIEAALGSGKSILIGDTLRTYQVNASYHRWILDGNEAMRIIQNGNVGIGTTNPINRLEVVDAVNRSMNTTADGQFHIKGAGYSLGIAMDGTAAHIYHNSTSRDLIFGTNETERLTIKGTGNVGIGTTTPSEKLEVDGNVKISGDMLKMVGITTIERNALTAEPGDIIYNTTDNKHQGYDGTTWNNLY